MCPAALASLLLVIGLAADPARPFTPATRLDQVPLAELGAAHRQLSSWERIEADLDSATVAPQWPQAAALDFALREEEAFYPLARLPDIGSEERLAGDAAVGFWGLLAMDARHYYRPARLGQLAVVLAGAAALANTSADQEFQDWWQEDVRSETTDGLSYVGKVFGEGIYMAPLMGLCCLAGEIWPDDPTAVGLWRWGGRTGRAYLVGAPALVLLQYATGASRPSDPGADSRWHPWEDCNGVAGHAFMGAVPFLTAAQLSDDWRVKYGCYAAASLTGISRINSDSHYLSQVLIAWWMAWAATQAIEETAQATHTVQALPMPLGDGMGLVLFWER